MSVIMWIEVIVHCSLLICNKNLLNTFKLSQFNKICHYRKYPNLVRTQVEIIVLKKSARIALELIFLVLQKLVMYKILNTLKLLWFTIDSSVLLNEGAQFFSFMTSAIVLFVLLIA